MDYSAFRKNAAQVRPSARQRAFMENPFYAFVHFSIRWLCSDGPLTRIRRVKRDDLF